MEIKDKLKQGIEEALAKALADGKLPAGDYPEVLLEIPPQKEFGDFSSNIAMQSARVAHKSPSVIADVLIEYLQYEWLTKVEKAGAGFLNFFVKSEMVYDSLRAALEAGENYGNEPKREDDTIQVEYVSANPTGPLHVGHGRGAAFGSALVNLMRAAGYNVSSEYYINATAKKDINLLKSGK